MARSEADLVRNDPTLYDRFWKKVDKRGPDDCWLWTAGTRAGRYGNIRVGGKYGPMLAAHRIQLIWCGHNMDGKVTLHSCDNGLCVNPKHLKPGTQLENNTDMMQKNRFVASKAENNGNSILSNEQVVEIKKKLSENINLNDISNEMNVNYQLIWRIAAGRSYSEIGKNINYIKPKIRSGLNHKNVKYTPELVSKCRTLYRELNSFTEISKIVGISSQAVRKLVRGEQWQGDVNGVAPITQKLAPVQQIGKRLLTQEQVYKIRELRPDNRYTAADIAKMFNISGSLVYAIWHNRAYQFVK
jgi:hypothetical protein